MPTRNEIISVINFYFRLASVDSNLYFAERGKEIQTYYQDRGLL